MKRGRNRPLNPSATLFVRGFLLGMLYAQGKVITTTRIREELRVSKATAKRDMQKVARLVDVKSTRPRRAQYEARHVIA